MNKDLLNKASKSFMENSQVDHLNLFDEKYNQNFKRANDEGRVSPYNDGSVHSSHESEDDFATSMGDKNTFSEGNVGKSPTNPRYDYISFDPNSPRVSNENRTVEKQPQLDTRLSNKPTKMPAKFNNYVVNSSHKKSIGSKWIFKIKYKAFGKVEGYKARLVAKGFSHKEGLDCKDTFSLVVKMTNVKFEDVYMYLPLGLVKNGFKQRKYDYSLYTKSSDNVFIALLVYVDDIVITENNVNEIEKLESFLSSKKYCLELLHEYGLLAVMRVSSPIPANIVLNHKETESDKCVTNVTGYQKLIGKLIYLTYTRLDISYDVHRLSQYMHCPLKSHMSLALRVLRYLKGSRGIGLQINKLGGFSLKVYSDSKRAKCPVTRKSVSRSSAEAEYRCMASANCELIWILNILNELKVFNLLPVNLFCDGSSAIKIATNPVFYEKTKHFELDIHLVKEKVASGVIETVKVSLQDLIVDIFTKGLDITQHKKLCKDLLLVDMFQLVRVNFCGEAYERNILEIQDKRGIVSANSSDVSNQSSSSSYVSIRKNDKGDMEIATPCMEATIQVTDLDENFLLLRLKDVTKKGNNYALWEVIVNEDSPLPKRTVNGVEQTYPPTTAEEKLASKNELKARDSDGSHKEKVWR
ncbi:ribonuclease H-like domain-containing protein [Tanacetum coccineum]